MSQETTVADREALLAISDERDAWLRRLVDAERAAYEAGYADGRADERCAADRTWAAQPPSKVPGGPTFAELEAARYTVLGEQRTRETFGLPHPDDYPGGPVKSDGRQAA